MRDSSLRERLWVFTMQGEDLAQPSNRIDLDPGVRDAWGFPAGRVTYSSHRHELVMSDHAAPILEAVLREAGAEWTITSTSPPRGEDIDLSPLGMAPASYHIMGTCRMGDDPATSVVDPSLRAWDVENLLDRRLVGVRHLGRLQPHAHDRGVGRPGRPPGGGHTPPRDHRAPLSRITGQICSTPIGSCSGWGTPGASSSVTASAEMPGPTRKGTTSAAPSNVPSEILSSPLSPHSW